MLKLVVISVTMTMFSICESIHKNYPTLLRKRTIAINMSSGIHKAGNDRQMKKLKAAFAHFPKNTTDHSSTSQREKDTPDPLVETDHHPQTTGDHAIRTVSEENSSESTKSRKDSDS